MLASWRSMTKKAGSESGSESISQRHGSADPDPDPLQNVMDPEHCNKVFKYLPHLEYCLQMRRWICWVRRPGSWGKCWVRSWASRPFRRTRPTPSWRTSPPRRRTSPPKRRKKAKRSLLWRRKSLRQRQWRRRISHLGTFCLWAQASRPSFPSVYLSCPGYLVGILPLANMNLSFFCRQASRGWGYGWTEWGPGCGYWWRGGGRCGCWWRGGGRPHKAAVKQPGGGQWQPSREGGAATSAFN